MKNQLPAVFLARDGVLNERVYDEQSSAMGSPLHPSTCVARRDAGRFVRGINELGFLSLVLTNQPGLAHGHLSRVRLELIHQRLREELAAARAKLSGIYYCPHHPDAGKVPSNRDVGPCSCRMPAPGMIFEAARTHRVDLYRSYLVGSDLASIQAGRAANLWTVLVGDESRFEKLVESRPEARPDVYVESLAGALEAIRSRPESMKSW